MPLKLGMVPVGKASDFLDPQQAVRAIENVLTMQAKAIKVDYGVTTRTWKNKPTFVIEKRPFERLIYTTDKVYGIVSAGARPHKIRARNAPMLAFQWGGPGSYKPKTQPLSIASRAGGATGPIVRRKEVNHPGHKARKFPEAIGKKWDERAPRQLQRAIASEAFR